MSIFYFIFNSELTNCFKNQLPLETQSRHWLKTFNNILFKCFRKIRVVDNSKKKDQNQILMQERNQMHKLDFPNYKKTLNNGAADLSIEDDIKHTSCSFYFIFVFRFV